MAMEHTVKSFDEQLRRLNEIILRMGGLAEAALSASIQAVTKRDVDLAAEIVRDDAKIDELNREVDELAVRLLALRQPMANDLREIVAALRISADVERIGDYAANIAKRAIAMSEMRPEACGAGAENGSSSGKSGTGAQSGIGQDRPEWGREHM